MNFWKRPVMFGFFGEHFAVVEKTAFWRSLAETDLNRWLWYTWQGHTWLSTGDLWRTNCYLEPFCQLNRAQFRRMSFRAECMRRTVHLWHHREPKGCSKVGKGICPLRLCHYAYFSYYAVAVIKFLADSVLILTRWNLMNWTTICVSAY